MKKIYIVYIILFVLMAAIPLAGMPFYRNNAESAEQRTLAEMPKLTDENGLNLAFPSGFEDYFQDHFAFRSELVNAGATILLRVFRSSAEDDVICGKDGWVFYSETLSDYSALKVLTDGELARLGTVLRLEQQYCSENGAAYIFMSAPNKNSVYPEYMMPQYLKAEKGSSSLDRLQTLLSQERSPVPFVDLKGLLVSEKANGRQLYYAADSHWNLLGATCAYRGIMEKINQQVTVSYDRYENAIFTAAPREGDLLKMVLPLNCIVEEANAAYDIKTSYKYEGRFRTIDDIMIRTSSGKADGSSLLMQRDSFGRALIPLLSEQFASAVYLRGVSFDIYNNIEGKTVVIHEIVERNLDTLLSRAPIVPAAAISAAEAGALLAGSGAAVPETEVVLLTKSASGGLTQIYGYAELPKKADADGGYRVFAEYNGQFYEGFPVYEEALAEQYGRESGKCGFSFYFEEEVTPEQITVYVV